MKSILQTLLVLLVLAGCIGGGVYWYQKHAGAQTVTYKTVPVQRGELLATISATGTLEPEEVVDVGAQVQGRIVNFGPDVGAPGRTVDYNAEVNEGAILAQI